MRATRILIISLAFLVAGAVFINAQPSTAEETAESVLEVMLTQDANTVPIHEVFEIAEQMNRGIEQ